MPTARGTRRSDPGDHVDALLEQWRRERPDLDHLDAMGVFSRLGRLAAHLTRSVEAVIASHGLSIGEFDVLAALRRSGQPFELKPTDLARSLMLSPAGVTSRLDRLEAGGHVERRMDPADRRSFLVRLTPAGRRTIDRAVTDHVAGEARLLAPLTAADRARFDQHLRRLLAQFEG
jgi:DNA-binding MarR family transcriptional regulator